MSDQWTDVFADVINGNAAYAAHFTPDQRSGSAARGLAVVTCMDSRLDPLGALGLIRGDAKILRNPGARVNDEVLAGLVLAVHLLGVTRILIIPHTDCRLAQGDATELYDSIRAISGLDVSELGLHTVADQQAALAEDIARVRNCTFIPPSVAIDGAIYDVVSGRLTHT